jgi:hypothetical protein
MTDRPRLSTPAAILVGSVIIASALGVATYFALRSSASTAEPTVAQHAPPQQSSVAHDASTVGAAAAVALEPHETLSGRVIEQAKAKLEQQRASLKTKCWDGPAAKNPQPAASRFVWSFTFDAEGKQLARGISEDRATLRPGTSICLSTELEPFEIAPPGRSIEVKVDFQLP